MKRFDIITIFPSIFDSYFSESILKRAQKDGKIEVMVHNLRDYTHDKHRTVDDVPYGGGAGMVMKVEPIYEAVNSIISNFQFPISKQIPKSKSQKPKTRVILFSAKGKRYTQKDAQRLLKYDNLILICGRYEGVDERVAEHIVDEEISIGDYVLTGGEVPAMVLVDSITRLIPGVLGNPESLNEESFGNWKLEIGNFDVEYPHYTRPAVFKDWKVPDVLAGGNHRDIERWRQEQGRRSTRRRRTPKRKS